MVEVFVHRELYLALSRVAAFEHFVHQAIVAPRRCIILTISSLFCGGWLVSSDMIAKAYRNLRARESRPGRASSLLPIGRKSGNLSVGLITWTSYLERKFITLVEARISTEERARG